MKTFTIGILILITPAILSECETKDEMIYYQAKCQWYETKPDHKVCKAGDMVIYFNLTDEDNLTEEQINELEERL